MRTLAATLVLLSGCAPMSLAGLQPACVTDFQCEEGQVCFPDGCGDPGQNIVVEITGNGTGLHAQDFKVDGSARATMNFDVRGPLVLTGRLERNAEGSGGLMPYTDGVVFNAHGKSDLLPGIFRTYSLVLPRADQAVYNMYLGAGTYTVIARPSDGAIPSERKVVSAKGGKLIGQPFEFKAFDQTLVLTGTLYKRLLPSPTFQTGMSIQAFESAGGQALSQLAQVQSNGSFELYIHPDAAALSSITLVATPRDNTVLVPTKNFIISPVPHTQETLKPLELGDFGSELPMVGARLVSSFGVGVPNATVTLEGAVNGGGSFRSRTVLTDSTGLFLVDLLPSAIGATFTLTAIPPPESSSGILQTQVRAGLDSMGKPALLAAAGTEPRTELACPDRVPLLGTVLFPDGLPASSVKVDATAIEPLEGRPVPTSIATTFTDANGVFRLMLDPARYRIDYVPGGLQLPRKSRVLKIEQPLESDAGIRSEEFYLSVGRTVSGLVTVQMNTEDLPDGGCRGCGAGTPTPNALVRFYRVTSVEGMESSLLVGEGYTDERGVYSIALPAAGGATR